MKITLLPETTEYPLTKIGTMAGICWNSDTLIPDKNIKRAQECILSGHGRVMEYVDIEFVLDEASARMMREIYTHIGGDPTRLQSSTRYVDAKNFNYFTPPKIENNPGAKAIYEACMKKIADSYEQLVAIDIPKEDAANVLPLGMHSKMVMKCNLRMLENFMHQRLCSRAYHEIRKFAQQLKTMLSQKNEEWEWIASNLFVPKCERTGFCTEAKCCGRKPKKV